jgi:hypothetical protein
MVPLAVWVPRDSVSSHHKNKEDKTKILTVDYILVNAVIILRFSWFISVPLDEYRCLEIGS